MRFVEVSRATTLHHDLPRRPSAAGTYSVQSVTGSEVQASAAASLDAVNTTLSGAAVEGAASVTVTSATGITAGRRYLIGGPQDVGGEWVTVRSVSGTTVTLVRRLSQAHASGATWQSTRVSFALPSIVTPARAYRVVYVWPTADDQPAATIPFDVTRWTPVTTLTAEDIRALDPLWSKRVPSSSWLPDIIAEAWETLCRRIASQIDPGALVGTVDLTTAHGYLVRALLAETAGQTTEAAAYRDDLRRRYAQELDGTLATLATDAAQSGAATARSGWYRAVRVVRG